LELQIKKFYDTGPKGRWNKPKNKMKKHLFCNLSPRKELMNKRETEKETETEKKRERVRERDRDIKRERERERERHTHIRT
jgi:hypothetical protein